MEVKRGPTGKTVRLAVLMVSGLVLRSRPCAVLRFFDKGLGRTRNPCCGTLLIPHSHDCSLRSDRRGGLLGGWQKKPTTLNQTSAPPPPMIHDQNFKAAGSGPDVHREPGALRKLNCYQPKLWGFNMLRLVVGTLGF